MCTCCTPSTFYGTVPVPPYYVLHAHRVCYNSLYPYTFLLVSYIALTPTFIRPRLTTMWCHFFGTNNTSPFSCTQIVILLFNRGTIDSTNRNRPTAVLSAHQVGNAPVGSIDNVSMVGGNKYHSFCPEINPFHAPCWWLWKANPE